MLALFDTYDDPARQLLRSLATAGIDPAIVVIQYDGDLPDGALCPFVTYTGIRRSGDPLFFNEVPVPRWCEIRQGREPHGTILRDGFVIGRIRYDPNSFRQVDSVEWLLRDGTLARIDRYDRHGVHYATTYYDGGTAWQTVYRGPGEWEIEVDHVSRVVTMRSADRLLTFERLADFVSHFLDDQGIATDRVLINSLSHPLFVARGRATAPNTTLFWQEPMPKAVPGNMAMELAQPRALERIVFDDAQLAGTVAAAHPDTTLAIEYLSPLGQFVDRGEGDPRRVFTLTNTDEMPALAGLLEALPDVTFSVAALTMMSDKLHGLARRHPNLELTPSITHAGIRTELERASVYLDINAGAHVLEVVKAAYHLDLVVFALAPHAKAPDHSRTFATAGELTSTLAAVVASPDERTRALDALHTQRGPLSSVADWRRVLVTSP